MTMTMHDRVLLSVREVSRSFDSYQAVRQVTFDVHEAEVLGIAGPNGAGKSTLFNLLSGVPFSASGGQIELDGRRIERLAGHRICRLGLRRTFQADQVFPELTVYENARLAAAYLRGGRGVRREAMKVLERTGLLALADARAGDISVLAKKKLMIAGALVGDVQVLLLDEPAGGLDAHDQDELASLIETLSSTGLTIVVIEHVLSLLRRVADRMIVMVAGEVLVTGRPEDVLADSRVVEAYLGEASP
ncbi:branched-chain amino acid transport system ATP-binding protein [Nocardioides kongjuensis]|uniref:Branched-chain amino acid transport system ATP-binding protein n=2 Tax=Nocardioides kongjuensis TaxID=349522 RepID=A0A852RPK2_9ACTN|nr:branched-chain amino acid transport system ATP-binding protein [Nocardioides kongjuensis]